jgi:hypothetical protein
MSQRSTAKSNPKRRRPSLPARVYRRRVNDSTYFLVSLGRDANGKQRWKSCRTLEKAKAERDFFLQAKNNEGEAVWLLSPQQRADAVSALGILRKYPGETLTAAATFYEKAHLKLIRSENLAALVEKYYAEQVGAGLSLVGIGSATQDEMMLYEVAVQLLIAEGIEGKRIRLIGVGGSNLVPPEIQSDLFNRTDEKRARVNRVMDDLRGKLGPGAIKRGSSLR